MRYDAQMQRTEAGATSPNLEAFEHAMANARRAESDLPSADLLLRAMRLFLRISSLPHEGEIEVFVAIDGSIELTAFGGDSQLIVEIADDSVEMLVKRLSSGEVVVSEAISSEDDIERWFERAA